MSSESFPLGNKLRKQLTGMGKNGIQLPWYSAAISPEIISPIPKQRLWFFTAFAVIYGDCAVYASALELFVARE
ncbi:hypothetical protein C8F04DRAFT_1264998 [Mycena alexandri]|uniref:Uncharacterized protein n=1 Tax=Mycena alexandri TaxID=1745969 RepID=A0AAD6WVW2_9AGAR|nr:hypothetical protein C8F04DRAFT_1264998 [Mycena alexandri]